MKEIKQKFFLYRNGAVADTLRRYGTPHRMIFGLDIPRIAEIARSLEPSLQLAMQLWNDYDVRESRLLATYLFPPSQITAETALQLASETRTPEESDMLAFRLLKRMPDPALILSLLQSSPSPAAIRTARSLQNHLA